MNKTRTMRAATCAMAAVLSVGTAATLLSGCTKEKRDNETTPLILASDLFDGVFNPFFYTSGVDGEVVAQTQIGMLSSDETGQPVAGEDEPCVSQAYSVVTTKNSTEDDPNDPNDYYTDYYFAIKNDITFSDGTPLTYKDVMFNIYMYLDPGYVGSSTMYSVDIQGLAQYRTQQADENASEDDFGKLMDTRAQARIDSIKFWAQNNKEGDTDALTEQNNADIDMIHSLFQEELNTDWTTAMNADMKEYEKYHFTENWQVFMYNYNQYTVTPVRNADREIIDYKVTPNFDTNMKKDQETLVDYVYQTMLGSRSSAIKTYKDNLVKVMLYYATASDFRSYLVSDETRRELAQKDEHGNIIYDEDGEMIVDLRVREVSGVEILFDQTSIPAGSQGNGGDLGGEYDVLHIRINGEDPKAIQNFSFTVAPMHYYSPIADQFNYGPGVAEEDYNFGVSWSDPDFMNAIRVNQVPLGAGPYRATNSSNDGMPADYIPDKNSFFNSNMVYLQRNDSFLLGAPKIKFLRYQVSSQSLLYEAINTGAVDYGSPTATNEMMGRLANEDADTLSYTITENLGYGYIGINAAFVEDINIRKAIMSVLDPQLALDYYGGGTLASILYRPMSSTIEWCYPDSAGPYYPYDETGETARHYVQLAGYTDTDGDGFLDDGNGNTLRYTFTIAGDNADHPAYATMENAADILNDIGFDITVTTDSTALLKLASGQLEVWAAAWSSSSDPDMYQVYHKDSTATSILNWGFPSIERGEVGTQEERDILDELALRIEQGRETTDQTERANIYGGMSGVRLEDGGDMKNLSALDLVMELAVEFPLYQRRALYVYQKGIFDEATLALFAESTAFQSPLSKIWLVSYAQ